MKNLARIIVLAIVVSILVSSMAYAGKEIKIGGIFALSGKAAQVGIPTKQVAAMVVDEINKKGGINGSKLKLVVADTRSEPSQAVVAMKKLIQRDRVSAIVGPTTTGEIMACIPTIQASKIPVVACVGGAAPVTPVRPWVFKSPQKSSSAVARIYMYLSKKGIHKIALLTATDKFGQEGEELLKQLAPSYKMNIVAHEKFDPTDADMSVQVGKIASSKPKAMIVWTIGPGGAVVTKNARQLKVPFQIVQCHGQPDPTYLKLAGSAADGTIMPSTKLMVANQLSSSDRQKKVEQAFVSEYKKRGYGQMGTHSGYAWDAIELIANAMKRVGTNPAKLRAAIENTKDYVGVSGIYNMSAKDHCGLNSDSLVMITVKGGKWKMIK
ncbi:ABC transporter substrate-binding protein [bacterium]|nr:ABC transporter substrate-binding protein [bacterium]